MKKLQCTVTIRASKEKVWHTILDDVTYRQWTAVFSPGSYYKGDWSKGSRMLFLGPDPHTGVEGGMVSTVVENRPYECISLKYIGFVHNGREDTESEMAREWATSDFYEEYTFSEVNGVTELAVDLNVPEDLAADFEKTWPEALEKIRGILEMR